MVRILNARRQLVVAGLTICITGLSACGGGPPAASPAAEPSSTSPSPTVAPTPTTAPRPVNYYERAQSLPAEALLGQPNFGYSSDQIATLKGTYGEDLSPYRHTLLVGDPASQDSVTTLFDFTGKLNEQGFQTMIRSVRSLAGTMLSDIDPMRDGSRLNAQLVLNQLSAPKVVVIGKDPQSIPLPTWDTQPPGFGATTFRNYSSIIPGAFVSVNIQETIWRELNYHVVPGPTLGPKLGKLRTAQLGTSIGESVGNSISGVVQLMVNNRVSEAAAKATVFARPGVMFAGFDDPIYGSDLSSLSLAAFADTTMFTK